MKDTGMRCYCCGKPIAFGEQFAIVHYGNTDRGFFMLSGCAVRVEHGTGTTIVLVKAVER